MNFFTLNIINRALATCISQQEEILAEVRETANERGYTFGWADNGTDPELSDRLYTALQNKRDIEFAKKNFASHNWK